MGKAIEMSVRLDRVLVDQIAGRWHLLILCALCDHQRKARFNALKRFVPGISQKTLTQCLRQLERSGLVARRVRTDSPLGVEYSFTPLGTLLKHRSRPCTTGRANTLLPCEPRKKPMTLIDVVKKAD